MAYPPPPPKRPIGVAILAILVILGGVLLTLFSLLLLLAAIVVIPVIGLLGVVIAGIALILSLFLLLAGFGLWNLRPWAWWLATIIVFLELVLQGLAVDWRAGVTVGGLLPLIIVGIIFVYLLAVRGSFRSTAYPR